MKEERCDKTGFCAFFPWVYPSDEGKYVLHEDYAALQAENERLRKAGDAVIEKLAEAYAGEPSDFDHAHVFKGWIEAKGEQPNK
jgi:hypothetical protein